MVRLIRRLRYKILDKKYEKSLIIWADSIKKKEQVDIQIQKYNRMKELATKLNELEEKLK